MPCVTHAPPAAAPLPLPLHAPRKQDYGCLFQKGADGSPRSPVQQQCFGAALDTMQLWYAHNKLCAFILSEFPPGIDPSVPVYDARGWCARNGQAEPRAPPRLRVCPPSPLTTAHCHSLLSDGSHPSNRPTVERAWTMLTKPNSAVCWPMLFDIASATGEAKRSAVLHPDRLTALLQTKRFTSPKADLPLVARLYKETAQSFFGRATRLHHARSGWGVHEFICFAEVLPLCMVCEVLNLSINESRSEGAAALAAAVSASTAVLPCLKTLYLSRNQIGDEGLAAFTAALRGGALPRLSLLDVSDNAASAEAQDELSTVCRERGITFIRQVELRSGKPMRRPLLGANETVRVGKGTDEQLVIGRS